MIFFMSALSLELSSDEITTIINSLLASTHLDPVTQTECFGLALKLQAALPMSLGTVPITVNISQTLLDHSDSMPEPAPQDTEPEGAHPPAERNGSMIPFDGDPGSPTASQLEAWLRDGGGGGYTM